MSWGFLSPIITRHNVENDLRRETEGLSALDFYEGWVADGQKPLRLKDKEPDDNVLVHYGALIVNKGVEFLCADEVGIQIGDERVEAADKFLQSFWPADTRAVDLIDLATNGGVFGHAWLKIVLDGPKRPRVVVLDPQNLRAEWHGEDYTKFHRLVNQFNIVDKNQRPRVIREEIYQEDGRWVIERSGGGVDSEFSSESKINWPYSFCPILHCKNWPAPNEFYGRSDLPPRIQSLVRSLWMVDSLIQRLLRKNVFPKNIARGVTKRNIEMGSDQMIFLSDPNAAIELLEINGELPLAMQHRRNLREAIAELSSIPEVASGKLDSVGQLSGKALQILYGPLLKRTKTKRRLYGKLIRDTVRGLLEIGGFSREFPITLTWADPLPHDEIEATETAIKQLEANLISRRTARAKLGLNSDAEEAQIAAERDADRQSAVTDLNNF